MSTNGGLSQRALIVPPVSECGSCLFLAGVAFSAHGDVVIDTAQGWLPVFFWIPILFSKDKYLKRNIKSVNAFDAFDLA